MPIIGKINVSKIDKNRLFQGAQGKYLDVILVETPGGKYGDWMICQSVSKEERQAGVKGAILGNGKTTGGGRPPALTPAPQPAATSTGEDVPF